ncbi:MAG: ABC transporter substrate-binding protein, partial [Spirochaetaceae bacterium]|nr:ABC transporter substrate-binding protein [Spirochaetaceae bacterium]
MMKKMKAAAAVMLAVLIGFAAMSCAKKDDAAGKEIVLSSYRDGSIDQLDAASYMGPHFLYKMIYEGFVEDGGNGEIIPVLAESWDIAPDNKTYTFHLRRGVKFSDGTDFDADAVIFNMKRWVNNSRYASLTSSKVANMTALDDHTVEIVFEDAFYPILTELTYPRPVRFLSPASVTDESGGIAFKMPVGTGP